MSLSLRKTMRFTSPFYAITAAAVRGAASITIDMDAAVRQLITALHQLPCRFVVALTGGGTGAASWLLSVPGGSRTVLEVVVPYAEDALCDYLRRRPESF